MAALLLRMGRGAFRRVRNTEAAAKPAYTSVMQGEAGRQSAREYRSSGQTCIYFGTCRVRQAGRHLGLWKDETLYWTEKKQYVKIVIIMGICAH